LPANSGPLEGAALAGRLRRRLAGSL